MLRNAWLTMNGLIVVFGLYNVVIRGIGDGNMSLITFVGPILIAAAAALVLLWRRNDEAAAVVAAILGLYAMWLASEFPLPVSMVLWAYAATMAWGAFATFSSTSKSTLLDSSHRPPSLGPQTASPTQAQTGRLALKSWRILTGIPLVLASIGFVLGVGVGLASYAAVKESNNNGWEGLGILVGGAIAVVSLVALVIGAGLIALAQGPARVAAGLSMPISLVAIAIGTQQGGVVSLVLVLWGLAHLVSAVGVVSGPSTQEQNETPPHLPPPPAPPAPEAIGRPF